MIESTSHGRAGSMGQPTQTISTVPASVRVAPWQDVGDDALVRLAEAALGTSPLRTIDFWRWKHRANPFGTSLGVVALSDGEPVALRLFLRWVMEIDGRPVACARAVDTATHAAWRRQGLFRHLTREALALLEGAGVELIFNTPNEKSAAGYLQLGWRTLGPAPLLVKLRGSLLRSALPWQAPRDDDPAWAPDLEPVRAVLATRGAYELLAGQPRLRGRLTTPRREELIHWRYETVPGVEYYAARTERSLLVARPKLRRGIRELALTELAAGGEPADLDELTGLLRSVAGSSGAEALTACACSDTPERDALVRAGFCPLPLARYPVLVRPLDGHEWATSLDRWRFSLGDLELF